MNQNIREDLLKIAEQDYKEFSSALIPKSKPLLGVRLPALRQMAKEIIKQDWKNEVTSYTDEYEDIYFEEVMLRGMIIGYGTAKGDIQEALELFEEFIPHVDNWSVCDSFCTSFSIAVKNRAKVWEAIQKYIYSGKEFEVRVGMILLLDQYLKYDCNGKKSPRKRSITMEDVKNDSYEQNMEKYPYLDKILVVLNRTYNQGYYAQMAAAWTIAEAFVTFPYETWKMLTNDCKLDDWTYNKALQKICESRNPEDDVKKMIKGYKRK